MMQINSVLKSYKGDNTIKEERGIIPLSNSIVDDHLAKIEASTLPLISKTYICFSYL